MPITALAVFCGSKKGNNPLYVQHAQALGKIFVQHNIMLIYGGGSTGIMGAIADTVMENNGKVTGVIPKLLVDWEHQHENLTELLVVDDMHARKKKLYELCDAAVILPGGFGTLDELFEMLTWNQLSIHNKPIYIINSAGFYNSLIDHMRNFEKDGFLYEKLEKRIIILDDPSALVQYLL
ncbi:MAG: family Rossman fold protein [Chitinophagaceae bacterium]|nr:family Rossman fold protein [Chitinophagaceae bacterium]